MNSKEKNNDFIQNFNEQILIFLELIFGILKAEETTALIEGIQILLIEVKIYFSVLLIIFNIFNRILLVFVENLFK